MKTANYKIVIFDGTFQTTTFIRRLMQGLVAHGHEVYVLGFNLHNPSPVQGVNYISLGSNQNKFEFITTSLRHQGLDALTNLLRFDRKKLQGHNLQYVLTKIKPNLIHVQWPSLLPWLSFVLRENNIPVVLSERGSQILIKPKVEKIFKEQLTWFYPCLKGIHAVSLHIAQTSKDLLNHQLFTRVIYSGINLNDWKFVPRKQKIKESIQFLSVGRAHYVKGYIYAIKALAMLKQKGVKFQYTIIGGQDEELSYLINYYQLNKQVKLLNKLSIGQVKKYYTKSDALLLPSLSEGVANVAIESMAVGLPVISANVGGMSELITHSETGFLFDSRSPVSLLAAIETYMNYPSHKIKLLLESARLKIVHNFTEKEMILAMIDFYKEVLGKGI